SGVVLTATRREGETWEKESKRGGLLRFSEAITEYRDAETGELIVTARMVGVRTEHAVSQEA
ncbi:MAG: FAS1-like dehydratase domain-containing protein, partial [Acidimicrobiales bacterium]